MITKTLYWDKTDRRYVLLVWNGEFARHHKFPKSILDQAAAEALADELDLGLDYSPALKAAA